MAYHNPTLVQIGGLGQVEMAGPGIAGLSNAAVPVVHGFAGMGLDGEAHGLAVIDGPPTAAAPPSAVSSIIGGVAWASEMGPGGPSPNKAPAGNRPSLGDIFGGWYPGKYITEATAGAAGVASGARTAGMVVGVGVVALVAYLAYKKLK